MIIRVHVRQSLKNLQTRRVPRAARRKMNINLCTFFIFVCMSVGRNTSFRSNREDRVLRPPFPFTFYAFGARFVSEQKENQQKKEKRGK
ncbi:hypothetical protein BKA57DRAFT_462154 [Linnemannia elongata]|nr:hypothetical protein BKA57DRAFT_462154 [Linnemannia elongata]